MGAFYPGYTQFIIPDNTSWWTVDAEGKVGDIPRRYVEKFIPGGPEDLKGILGPEGSKEPCSASKERLPEAMESQGPTTGLQRAPNGKASRCQLL